MVIISKENNLNVMISSVKLMLITVFDINFRISIKYVVVTDVIISK